MATPLVHPLVLPRGRRRQVSGYMRRPAAPDRRTRATTFASRLEPAAASLP